MNATLQERAERGAAWLDQATPGWQARVNLDEFDVGSAECCVLSYAFPAPSGAAGRGFSRGLDALGASCGCLADNALAVAYGFGLNEETGQTEIAAALTQCWVTLILTRRCAAEEAVRPDIAPTAGVA